MKRFLQENKLELIAIGVLFIGVFLVLDQYVRSFVIGVMNNVIHALVPVLQRMGTSISARLAGLSAAEFVGGVLIVGAAGLLVWRIRQRFRTGQKWGTISCPKCSSPIRRVHRNWWDRVLGVTFLPEARRYRCVNPDCRWSGLRRRNILPHHYQPHEELQPLP